MNTIWKYGLMILLASFVLPVQGESKKPKGSNGVYAKENFTRGYRQNNILDLVLIYQGGVQRTDWTVEEMMPYVVHTNRFGKKDWFYDGFLFLEFQDGKGRGFAQGYSDKNSARKQEWSWLADRHFAEGRAIPALNACVAEGIGEIGKPSFKHKVVIGLPEPILDQKDWGEINGKALDFSTNEDRIAASKWYIDELLKRFDENKLENVELAGFYWVAEHMGRANGITTEIGDYVRSKGKQFYWIPYYSSNGFSQWKEYGFDIAYLQPNYFFNTSIADDRVDNACAMAYAHNMGVEMEFDGNALAGSKNNKRNRLVNYIQSFQRNNVYKESAIAYYEGGRGIYQMAMSKDMKDKEMLDTLASFVLSRRNYMSAAPVYEMNFSGAKALDDKVWSVEGDAKNIRFNKSGLILSSGKSATKIVTKNKIDLTYGNIEVRAKVLAKDKDARIKIRLMPTEAKLGEWPKSGDLFLMNYDGNNPLAVRCGANTGNMNELKKNIKESVFYVEELHKTAHTYRCEWEEKKVVFYVDGMKTNIQEDLFDKIYSDYPVFWPFNEKFYLEISVESPSGKAAVCIEYIKITNN